MHTCYLTFLYVCTHSSYFINVSQYLCTVSSKLYFEYEDICVLKKKKNTFSLACTHLKYDIQTTHEKIDKTV